MKKPRFSDISPPLSELAQRAYLKGALDPIQNDCKYGYVLPDRSLCVDCGKTPQLQYCRCWECLKEFEKRTAAINAINRHRV